MPVDSLSQKLSPPECAVETTGSWRQVEDDIGKILPTDYKSFIDTYGSGSIGNFLTVLNPFSSRPGLNLLHQGRAQLEVLRSLAEDFGEPRPYELHPAPGGLLPLALTDNGDVVHWLTEGDPDEWAIIVNEARSADYERFDGGITMFLEALLDGSTACNAFPTGVLARDPNFYPLYE